jgi:RNA polymerase sigma-70 factor, ECF subfamily
MSATNTRASAAMDRYAGGDSLSFAELHALLAPRLYGYLLRSTHDHQRAEDLLQQSLLSLHAARDRFLLGADVVPWAFAIARRTLISSYRYKKREALVLDLLRDQSTNTVSADPLEHNLLAKRVQQELQKLPEKQRVAFVLTKIEGLSVQEVADRLNTTPVSVKLRVHRAAVSLRQALA